MLTSSKLFEFNTSLINVYAGENFGTKWFKLQIHNLKQTFGSSWECMVKPK